MTLDGENFMLLTTYRRTGEGVSSPVWLVPVSDGRLGFWTADGSGKTKRLRHTDRVTVQACGRTGKPKDGSSQIAGTAEMVKSGPLFDEVQAKVKKKYGFEVPITKLLGKLFGQRKAGQTYADTAVLVRV